jgi:methionyl-tRNA synthetase
VRTTEPRHERTVQQFWQQLQERGQIYLGEYEGWYCVPDESFVPELQVTRRASDGVMVTVDTNQPVEWVKEQNYRFRLSHFYRALEQWLEQDPHAIVPPNRHKEILNWLKQQQQQQQPAQQHDLSISRPTSRVKWALTVPGDERHSIYVWLDALVNYLTVAGYGETDHRSSTTTTDFLWPPDYQIIGKDILTFHAIYWPAFLIANGLQPPRRLISHAHWTVGHRKMSKSLGNVVDAGELLDRFGIDSVRYFLLKEGGLVDDGDFSELKLSNRLKGELADTFGNLVSRVLNGKTLLERIRYELPSFSETLLDGDSAAAAAAAAAADVITTTSDHARLAHQLESLVNSVGVHFEQCDFPRGIETIFAALHETNAYFTRHEPWKLASELAKRGEGDNGKQQQQQQQQQQRLLSTVLFLTLESIRICSILLSPIMPDTSALILDRLAIPMEQRTTTNCRFFPSASRRMLSLTDQPIRPFQVITTSSSSSSSSSSKK